MKKNLMNDVDMVYITLREFENELAKLNSPFPNIGKRVEESKTTLQFIKYELHKIPMSNKKHRILVNSAIYNASSTGEERKHVVLSYYKGNNECVILTEFDYALTDWEKVLLVDWISKCAKEDPDKLFEFLEEY